MTTRSASYRTILRSTFTLGGASVVNIVIGLVRIKAIAVLLGPAGLGLTGLLQNLMLTGATIIALGFGNAGARQIAEAAGREDNSALQDARRALFWGTLILALLGASMFVILHDPLAIQILGDLERTNDVAWLGLGVGLSVLSGSQMALLNGLRRIGDIARVTVGAALLSAVIGVGAILIWGNKGILILVLSGPLSSFLFGRIYVSRIPGSLCLKFSVTRLAHQWWVLVSLGTAFMLAGLVESAGQLAVRSIIQKELGAPALGHFQAAWTISMTYLGFVLAAMGTDYYPRLTAIIHDKAKVNRMVNEQTEIAILLAAPVLLTMIGAAPWVIKLLYSVEFRESVLILRWQIVADTLKLASWPLSFIILSAGDGRTYVLTEALSVAAFVGLTWFAIPLVGIQGAGVAVLGMYIAFLPAVYYLARKRTGFEWEKSVRNLLVLLFIGATVVGVVGTWGDLLGLAVGLVFACGFSVATVLRLSHMADIGGRLGKYTALMTTVPAKIKGWF